MTDTTEGGDTAAVEAEARAMGWVPPEEFRGDPGKAIDAKTFVAKSQTELPVIRERLRNANSRAQQAERTAAGLTTALAETRATQDEFRDWHEKTEERAYSRAVKDMRVQQKEAVAEGDAQKAAELGDEIKDAEVARTVTEAERLISAQPQANGMQQEAIPPEVAVWVTANPWFQNDPELYRAAVAHHEALGATAGHLTLAQNLEQVTAFVRRGYPEKFRGTGNEANPRRGDPATVEGGSGVALGGVPEGQRTFGNLPSEAKQACDRFVKDGLIKNRDTYVKDYDWSA